MLNREILDKEMLDKEILDKEKERRNDVFYVSDEACSRAANDGVFV